MPLEQKAKLQIKSFVQILDGTFEGALTFSSTAVGMSDKSKSPNNVFSDEVSVFFLICMRLVLTQYSKSICLLQFI